MMEHDRASVFEHYRPRLFGIAYRMLGSVEDAKDLTQETYLRWHQADAAAIRAPEGWLVAVVTRLSIDRLRHATLERESYVGDWLPEPIATDGPSAPDRQAELASDLSMAFLVLLERLAPEERAAFLLREVLDADYGEIARVLEKSEPACRQMVHRARARVREDRTRFPVAPEAKERLAHRFLAALQSCSAWSANGRTSGTSWHGSTVSRRSPATQTAACSAPRRSRATANGSWRSIGCSTRTS
jgi:RNA polymerase sigma-70 factor (ECF subfamily)